MILRPRFVGEDVRKFLSCISVFAKKSAFYSQTRILALHKKQNVLENVIMKTSFTWPITSHLSQPNFKTLPKYFSLMIALA